MNRITNPLNLTINLKKTKLTHALCDLTWVKLPCNDLAHSTELELVAVDYNLKFKRRGSLIAKKNYSYFVYKFEITKE